MSKFRIIFVTYSFFMAHKLFILFMKGPNKKIGANSPKFRCWNTKNYRILADEYQRIVSNWHQHLSTNLRLCFFIVSQNFILPMLDFRHAFFSIFSLFTKSGLSICKFIFQALLNASIWLLFIYCMRCIGYTNTQTLFHSPISLSVSRSLTNSFISHSARPKKRIWSENYIYIILFGGDFYGSQMWY